MKITIDTATLTIQLEEEVTLSDLTKALDDLFYSEILRTYKLKPFHEKHIYPTVPKYPYIPPIGDQPWKMPWQQPPTIIYTAPGTDNPVV